MIKVSNVLAIQDYILDVQEPDAFTPKRDVMFYSMRMKVAEDIIRQIKCRKESSVEIVKEYCEQMRKFYSMAFVEEVKDMYAVACSVANDILEILRY